MTARAKGFTLVDLLVVIVCVAILIVIPACITGGPARVNREARMLACKVNLNGIGRAIVMYRGEDKNARFPLLFTTGRPEANIEASHASRNIDELKSKLHGNETAMQNVWVIIDKELVTEEAFACPADTDYAAREFKGPADRIARKVGWWSSEQFSYGLHFPYKALLSSPAPGGSMKRDNPAYLGPHLKGSFVVMADKNPSQNNEPATGVGAGKKPSNHGDLGEGYLTYIGAVGWKKGAEDSNVNGDDIYTIDLQEATDPAFPANRDDQYIVRHPALPAKP